MKFAELYAGQVLEFGAYTVTEDEIKAFATRYDPQPFHIDSEAAEASRWRPRATFFSSVMSEAIGAGLHTAKRGLAFVALPPDSCGWAFRPRGRS